MLLKTFLEAHIWKCCTKLSNMVRTNVTAKRDVKEAEVLAAFADTEKEYIDNH